MAGIPANRAITFGHVPVPFGSGCVWRLIETLEFFLGDSGATRRLRHSIFSRKPHHLVKGEALLGELTLTERVDRL